MRDEELMRAKGQGPNLILMSEFLSVHSDVLSLLKIWIGCASPILFPTDTSRWIFLPVAGRSRAMLGT